MNQAQKVFEALMRTKGHSDFEQINNKYKIASLQVRWNYFQLGWEMKGVATCLSS